VTCPSGSDLKTNICEANIKKLKKGDLPVERSRAVTSSIQRCPTAKSSGDLKQEKSIRGRNNDGNVADFFCGCAVGSHLVIQSGGVTQHYDAVGGLCVIRYGGGHAARRGQGNF